MSSLHPVVYDLLVRVRTSSGRDIEVCSNPKLSGVAARSLHAAHRGTSCHLIEYRPSIPPDHAIAHECAHLLAQQDRLEEGRLYYPVIPGTAFADLYARLYPRRSTGRRDAWSPQDNTRAIDQELWHAEKLVTQVARQAQNFPQDLQIEQWLSTAFPALAALQEQALLEDLTCLERMLMPQARDRFPPLILRAHLAMHYALTRGYSQRLPYSDLRERAARALPHYPHPSLGNRLLAAIPDDTSQIYRDEVRVTTEWMTALDIPHWIYWRKLDAA
ncbi:MAG: hypothetical protein V1784_04725 [bacterium]